MSVPLSAPLSLSLTGAGETPIKLELDVRLWPSDEVSALRAELAELQATLATERETYRRLEYQLRCEVMVNIQLVDLCREAGLQVPSRLRRDVGSIAL